MNMSIKLISFSEDQLLNVKRYFYINRQCETANKTIEL